MSYFFFSVITTMAKSNLRRETFILAHRFSFIIKGSQSRNDRKELEEETKEEHCFLAPYKAQAYMPRSGANHCGLGHTTSIINQENAPQPGGGGTRL